ncbi:polymer-forming cytoskeletal protein [Gracilimonas sp.]|uniref:bactofilin family protein n=1 Tax=Gracilimonas sp. TaxID=1974203 RepID=UPI0025C25326|nr:polymer-forming cytoskeletal protein [Gracilimonas sp.]
MRLKPKSNTVKNDQSPQSPAITYITKPTEITGDIKCSDDLRIAGTVEGDIRAKQKVILTDSGVVKGTIHSPSADIAGKMTGDVRTSEKLTLRPTAIIDGEIFTKKITIEDGAQIKGSLQVGPDIEVEKRNTQKSSDSMSSNSVSASQSSKNETKKEKDDTDDNSDSEKKSGSKNSGSSTKLSV